MNLILKRNEYRPDGIFGILQTEDGSFSCLTLEHAYDDGQGSWVAKVAPGSYSCIRHAPNRLPYTTFMLQQVPDFQGQGVTGILIHILNTDNESKGCIGVGESIQTNPDGEQWIGSSKSAFTRFMDLQSEVNFFALTIVP